MLWATGICAGLFKVVIFLEPFSFARVGMFILIGRVAVMLTQIQKFKC